MKPQTGIKALGFVPGVLHISLGVLSMCGEWVVGSTKVDAVGPESDHIVLPW